MGDSGLSVASEREGRSLETEPTDAYNQVLATPPLTDEQLRWHTVIVMSLAQFHSELVQIYNLSSEPIAAFDGVDLGISVHSSTQKKGLVLAVKKLICLDRDEKNYVTTDLLERLQNHLDKCFGEEMVNFDTLQVHAYVYLLKFRQKHDLSLEQVQAVFLSAMISSSKWVNDWDLPMLYFLPEAWSILLRLNQTVFHVKQMKAYKMHRTEIQRYEIDAKNIKTGLRKYQRTLNEWERKFLGCIDYSLRVDPGVLKQASCVLEALGLLSLMSPETRKLWHLLPQSEQRERLDDVQPHVVVDGRAQEIVFMDPDDPKIPEQGKTAQ